MSIVNDNYELLEERLIKDLNSMGYILRHKKTGARVVLLANDDENKVFNIGFKTPPKDDTGLPHILEHSVLCGSAKYPAKDPFVELCKGSLNTFLNAMTYPDKTVYPVASCNEVDFKNIVDVYMDAVFNPNIYTRKEIFMQEGWHYELNALEAPLAYNGVVYNEMKGAFSDPDSLLSSKTFKVLFPDNEYGNESGGDPDAIPTLSYEKFIEFHKKYYHPSNSYIYVYGDIDMEWMLSYLDEQYLSKYEYQDIDTVIKPQKAFEKPLEVEFDYAVTPEEGTKDNAILSYNWVVGNVLDPKLYLAFQIIDYALVSAPGAPVKCALTDGKIGLDIYGSYENSVYQPIFSIVARNADENKKTEFKNIIFDTLSRVVNEGIDKKAFLAGINYYEFKYREADFGSYPKGLMYGLQALDSWLYDDMSPFIHIESGAVFEYLKKAVDTGYFEEIIKKYILDNNHSALISLIPKENLTSIIDEKVNKGLSQYKNSLSNSQLEKIIFDTKHLKEYQDEPSTQEELMTIPMLKREDIKKEAANLFIEKKQINDTTVIHSNLFTSRIAYINMSFSCDKVREELIPYVGLLRNVLGLMDTQKYKYGELFNEININCGGIVTSSTVYTDDKEEGKFSINYEVKAKTLYEKLDFVFDTVWELIYTTQFTDYKRLKEILDQVKSRVWSRINNAGHVAAISQTMAQFSPSMYYNNIMTGIAHYNFICELIKNYDESKEDIAAKLKELTKLIFDKNNLITSVTLDDEGYHIFKDQYSDFIARLNANSMPICEREFKKVHENIAYATSSQVNYVALCGNFKKTGYDYTGALKILKTIFGYDYLWNNIRVKGGAYGCMSGFYKNGDSYMVSYRDPNIRASYEVYKNAVDYIREFSVTERDMTKYVIGTIGELDTPANPLAKGNRSFSAYMSSVSYEELQKERDEILNATANDIRNLWALVKEVVEDNYCCVIGNADSIKKENELFDRVISLS